MIDDLAEYMLTLDDEQVRSVLELRAQYKQVQKLMVLPFISLRVKPNGDVDFEYRGNKEEVMELLKRAQSAISQ